MSYLVLYSFNFIKLFKFWGKLEKLSWVATEKLVLWLQVKVIESQGNILLTVHVCIDDENWPQYIICHSTFSPD
jgi:hypothetical protein